MPVNDLAIEILKNANKAQAAVAGTKSPVKVEEFVPLAIGGLAGGAVFFAGGKVAKLCAGCVVAMTAIGVITGAYLGYEWRKKNS